jgi:hypothetical protein
MLQFENWHSELSAVRYNRKPAGLLKSMLKIEAVALVTRFRPNTKLLLIGTL